VLRPNGADGGPTDSANGSPGQQAGTIVSYTLQGMWGNFDFKARPREMLRATAARVGRQRRRSSVQAQEAANALRAAEAEKDLTSERRIPTMRSARQDKVRGRIDKIAGRVLEWFGRLTGNRSTVMKGKAARGRGMGRTAMGRLKRIGH
jgi:uncharacterized protein YjbJ (UPF0337 family)